MVGKLQLSKAVSGCLKYLVFFLIMVVTNCKPSYETIYSSRFSESRFSNIQAGMSESELINMLGAPFDTSTHVVFPNGQGSNNYPGKLLPQDIPSGAYIKHFTLHFSREKLKYQDFEVINVFVGINGQVIETDRYLTD